MTHTASVLHARLWHMDQAHALPCAADPQTHLTIVILFLPGVGREGL